MTNLIYLIPFFPLLAFALITLFANKNKKLSGLLAIAAIASSWIISWVVFFQAWTDHHFYEHPIELPLFSIPTGESALALGFRVDSLTAVMLFMVPFVCLMIFIYAWGYMGIGKKAAAESGHGEHGGHGGGKGWPAGPENVDPLASRFFAYISLFACGMLGLVLADNLLLLFVFWELMGLCSYLLISFWFARKYDDPKRITPKKAGFKAFITTRVGDAIMFAGMMLLYASAAVLTNGEAGLTFSKLFEPEVLAGLQGIAVPVFGTMATLIAILIFWGAIGKSAQFPLHVWLPDAMEGPTPVSALIHAATMVSAGVYLIIRMYPLMIAGSTPALTFIGVIGAFTALFAAIIAVSQTDIKRVLAYSTVSQLGFMFAALGIGAYVAAAFHLITHAFFKGLALPQLRLGDPRHGARRAPRPRTRPSRGPRLRRQRHALYGRPAQEDARHLHRLPGRRPGLVWLPPRYLRLLEQGRDSGRSLPHADARRRPASAAGLRLLRLDHRRLLHSLLHLAADHHDLPGQAPHRVGRQRVGKQQADGHSAADPGCLHPAAGLRRRA